MCVCVCSWPPRGAAELPKIRADALPTGYPSAADSVSPVGLRGSPAPALPFSMRFAALREAAAPAAAARRALRNE